MIERKTIFSPCRKYRYTLWREWATADLFEGANDGERGNRLGQYVQFIGLNPSTADETNDDPTIRRCIDFAKRWGFGAICMTNAFAWRDTDPEKMKSAPLPVSHFERWNDIWLRKISEGAGLIVAAWGKHGRHLNRDLTILELIPNLHCLGINNDGTPKHPLYLGKDSLPVLYKPE